MNILLYLLLGIVIVGTPFMLVKAIRSGQKKRIFDFFVNDLLFSYLALNFIWPSVTASAPPILRLLVAFLCIVWIANFFGAFQRLFDRQKAIPIERR